jgi:hypothetical protein
MKVIRHDDKFMKEILLFCSVKQHEADEEARDFVSLEKAHFHRHICGDEVGRLAGGTAIGYTQQITSAAEAGRL